MAVHPGVVTPPPVSARTRFRREVVVVAAMVAAVGVWLAICSSSASASTLVSDGAGAVAAAGAVLACAVAASQSRRGDAVAWTLMAVACGLWCAGEVVWAFQEILLGDDVPFPSVADVAYLAAAPVAVVALLAFCPGARAGLRVRTVLDGAIVAGALLYVAWAVVLGDVWRAAGVGVGDVITIAYPVSDVVVVVVAILAVRWCGAALRRPLALVAAALVVMAFTDVSFTWLINEGTFTSANPVSLGWVAAYALIALAARMPDATAAGRPPVAPTEDGPRPLVLLLPYLPCALAVAVTVPRLLADQPVGPFLTVTGVGLIALVLVRQGILAFDLRATIRALHHREDELARLALHDPLTGLANRTLLGQEFERLEGVGDPRALLYLDLDGFKALNDALGHAVGDRLLVEVGRRLAAAAEDGLVSRLGGDEFVVLVAADEDLAVHLAGRLAHELAVSMAVDGMEIRFQASVGVAVVDEHSTLDEALRRADAAMYTAKKTGKGRVVLSPEPRLLVG